MSESEQNIPPKVRQVRWQRQKDSQWLPWIWYAYFLIAIPYIIWRTTVINWSSWHGALMYLAELYGVLTTALFLYVTKKVFIPVKSTPDLTKSVDVLIPTYNEPLEILEPVVIGATKIRGVRQVLVLDDSNRSEVRAMAQHRGARYYPRTDNRFAKAGNMNNGLKHTNAEFIITLDADHIPLQNFVEETLGFFDDPHIAFVQSPQTFYNTHAFLFRKRPQKEDWSEQTMFYNCLQPSKNNWNAAFFVGTSAILRRAAIDQIGGFATGTATEDIHTSLRLHARGWQSVFLPRPLAYGLEAESYNEFYKQRRRWAAGSLGLMLRSPDSPLWARGLTFSQRLNYLSACLAHLQGVQKLCFLLIPIITIFTNIFPVSGNLNHFALFFAIYLGAALSATWAFSRGTYHPIYTEMFALANIPAHLGGIKGILKVQKKFAVSNKLPHKLDGRGLIIAMWGLASLAILALIQATVSYFFLRHTSTLVLACLVFIAINSVLLVSFLLKLRAYEKDNSTVNYQSLSPIAKYRYVVLDWRLRTWQRRQDVEY